MQILYDRDIDYLELFFKKAPNFGEAINKDVTVFRSEKSRENPKPGVVGYGFDDAHRTVFAADFLSANLKLACLLKMVRAQEGLTQAAAAKRIGGLTLRHYQRLESGEENTTLEMLEKISGAFPSVDFTFVLDLKRMA